MLNAIPNLPAGFSKSTLSDLLLGGFGTKGSRHSNAVVRGAKLAKAGVKPEGIYPTMLAMNDAGEHPLPREELLNIAEWAGRIDVPPFEYSESGKIVRNSRKNVEHAIAETGVKLSRNDYSGQYLMDGVPLSDSSIRRLWFLIEKMFGFRPTKDFFWEAVLDIAAENAFDPVLDHVKELQMQWDGTIRLDTWLIDHCGAADTPFNRAVSSIILIAAVRRVTVPGCKFDTMLVLIGPQGCGKSTVVRTLAGKDEWFADHVPFNSDGREVMEMLSGHWFVEAGELHGLGKAGTERMKSFLSRQCDNGRAAYARMAQTTPRRCVFIGTTNAAAFLTDGTGNRRFLPVEVGNVDLGALAAARDQLMAEAAVREAAGESITLPSELWAVAAEAQDARRIENPLVSLLQESLEGVTGRIRSTDVWSLLDIPVSQRYSMASLVSSAMQELGWKPSRYRFGSESTCRGYAKGNGVEQRVVLVPAAGRTVRPQQPFNLRSVS